MKAVGSECARREVERTSWAVKDSGERGSLNILQASSDEMIMQTQTRSMFGSTDTHT
jgi:hypothetical protein